MLNKLSRTFFILAFFVNISVQSQTLKILPLGNSLTKGVYCNNGTITNCVPIADSEMTGYRYPLYLALSNAGFDFTYVGNELAGWLVFPTTQLAHHAGYPGIRTDQLADKLAENNGYLLNSTAPDVILLEIGTNDIMAGISAASFAVELTNILEEIDTYETSSGKPVLVFLSKIIRFKQGALYGGNVATYNTAIQTVYNQRVIALDKIQLLDVGSTLINLQEPTGDMKDELHPNQGGYDKMAAQWFQAINNFNSAPVPSQIPNQQVQEGSAFSVINLDGYISDTEDPDNMIVWTVATEPQNFSVTINASRQATITPKNTDWNGSESITFIATDRGKIVPGLKKSASISATFTVLPVNDAPVINGQTRTPVTMEETAYLIVLSDLNVQDIDNSQSELTVQVLSGANYTSTGNSVMPAVNFTGSLPVSIRVNDLSASSQIFSFNLSVSAKNDPPIINSANAISINEDTPLKLRLIDYQVTDPDNFFPADFTLTIGNGQHYTHSGDTVFPEANYDGTLEVLVTLRDLLDQSNEFVHEINVLPVNDPPVLIISAIDTVYEGNFLEFPLAAYDPDVTDPLVISAVALPVWLTHNSESGKISGTPLHQHVGNNVVTMRVNDSHVSVDSTFIVEVMLGTSTRDFESSGFALFPNPASHFIHLKLKPGTYSLPHFRLYTITGALVIDKEILNDDNVLYLEDYSINPGIYLYELSEKQVIFAKGKLVVTPNSLNR